jgi:glutathione reductase (NADPH)
MRFDYDLLVIGAGSGGLAGAERAASYGARVAIAEKTAIGGTCVNHGCVPEKLMNYAADFITDYADAYRYGLLSATNKFDWARFVQAIERRIQYLQDLHQKHLDEAGTHLLPGQATFLDPHTLQVGDRCVTAARILIAVGATWDKPDIPGSEHAITSRELFHLPQQPQTLAVVGGGYIGTKSASSLAILGSQVTQIVPEHSILTAFDAELATAIQTSMAGHGVRFQLNSQLAAITPNANGFTLTFREGAPPLTVDAVLLTSRRQPNLSELNLADAGVGVTDQGAIAVDAAHRTSQPHIFAVGDATELTPLTPVAIAAARDFAYCEFGQKSSNTDYRLIPVALSAQPEAASVGCSEVQAQAQFGASAVACYRTTLPFLSGVLSTTSPSFLKLVTDSQSKRVLGVHLVGHLAIEVIQCLAIALRRGVTQAELEMMLGLPPELALKLVHSGT